MWCISVCAGANERPDDAAKLSQEIADFLQTSTRTASAQTQLEDFICRRAAMLASSPSPGPDPAYCRLLAYEMLFLWNALPSSHYNNVITKGRFDKLLTVQPRKIFCFIKRCKDGYQYVYQWFG